VSDSSARVKETKEARYDTDEGGFLLVFPLHHTGAVLLFCLFLFVLHNTASGDFKYSTQKEGCEVFVFINNYVHGILSLHCCSRVILADVD
jgi:uncharacterized integral membrane protein